MSRLANWLFRISARWADRRGREPRVVIGPGGPEFYWSKPEATERYGWDDTHYHRGCVNVKGIYNPVKLTKADVADDEVDVIPSENYKSALLANEIIPKALNPLNMDQLRMYILATLAVGVVTLMAIGALFGQV